MRYRWTKLVQKKGKGVARIGWINDKGQRGRLECQQLKVERTDANHVKRIIGDYAQPVKVLPCKCAILNISPRVRRAPTARDIHDGIKRICLEQQNLIVQQGVLGCKPQDSFLSLVGISTITWSVQLSHLFTIRIAHKYERKSFESHPQALLAPGTITKNRSCGSL